MRSQHLLVLALSGLLVSCSWGDSEESSDADYWEVMDAEGSGDAMVSPGSVGAPCAAAKDCDGGICLTHPTNDGFIEGYCSAECDPTAAGACGGGASCFDFDEEQYCLKTCDTKADCRQGYGCAGTCLPESWVSDLAPTSVLPTTDSQVQAVLDAVDDERVLSWMRVLSGAEPVEGDTVISSRSVEHPDHELALEWLRGQIEEAGLTVNEVTGSGTTLWTELPGTDTDLAPVVIVAHYDSISEDDDVDLTADAAPGANDNASGVAIALEMLSAVADAGVTFPRSLRIVFSDAEEEGYLGAIDYVNALPETAEVACSLITDTLAGAPGATHGRFWFNYNGASADYAALGAEAFEKYSPASNPIYALDESDIGTDSVPFRNAGFCSISMYCWPYPVPTHAVEDTVDNIEPDFLAENTRAALAVATVWLLYEP